MRGIQMYGYFCTPRIDSVHIRHPSHHAKTHLSLLSKNLIQNCCVIAWLKADAERAKYSISIETRNNTQLHQLEYALKPFYNPCLDALWRAGVRLTKMRGIYARTGFRTLKVY